MFNSETPEWDADVHFGHAGKPLPDWRSEDHGSSDDDDAPPTDHERRGVIGVLGFDPRDFDAGGDGGSERRMSYERRTDYAKADVHAGSSGHLKSSRAKIGGKVFLAKMKRVKVKRLTSEGAAPRKMNARAEGSSTHVQPPTRL